MSGVLLVTGGSRGVGAAICRVAARGGFKVAVNYLKAADKAAEVVNAIRAARGEAIAVQGDCTHEADIVELFTEIDRTLGRITALVNNAGGGVGLGPVEDTTTDRLSAVMGLNLIGPILCAREAVRRMSTDRGGHGGAIVNVSSMSAFNGGFAGLANYAAAKGGLESFTIGLANEVGSKGIRVNCIRLGAFETDAHLSDTPEWRATMLRTIVLNRYGRPEEAAAAATFLLSEEASYITGAILNVSGGRR
jgi:NAD(P)-dependent dehydrogenase (short-subunit alcohol dehydrogenase family)